MTAAQIERHILDADADADRWQREGAVGLPAVRRRDAAILRGMLVQRVAEDRRNAYTQSPASAG